MLLGGVFVAHVSPDLQGLARAGRDNRPGDDCSEAQTSGCHRLAGKKKYVGSCDMKQALPHNRKKNHKEP